MLDGVRGGWRNTFGCKSSGPAGHKLCAAKIGGRGGLLRISVHNWLAQERCLLKVESL